MVEGKKRTIFAVLNHEAGRGPARLRRLFWEQEIAGSNPAAPTTKAAHKCERLFLCARAKACFQASSKQKQPQACAAGSGFCRNLIQTETFSNHVPLRQANMVLMVDSEPHC